MSDDNRLSQFDMVFLNSALIKDMDLGMCNKGFDLTKWFDYSASLQNCGEISLNKKNSREVPVSGRPTILKRAMRYFFPP